MPRGSDYRRRSGAFVGAFIVALTLTPLHVHSQVQSDEPAPARRSMEQPPDRSAPPGSGPAPTAKKDAGSDTPAQDSPRRRPPAEEFDDPFATVHIPPRNDPPHPLAVVYPNHNVIVCIAGCGPHTPTIVYIAPRESTTEGRPPVQPAALALIATTPAPIKIASASDRIECVAGCYDRRR